MSGFIDFWKKKKKKKKIFTELEVQSENIFFSNQQIHTFTESKESTSIFWENSSILK